MGKLIAVIGNVAVGKTTFARQLCAHLRYTFAPEKHADRPFHAEFAADRTRSAFQNQLDFLLMRAEQEHVIRSGPGVGVVDGGLDQDFYVFSRYFAHIGALTQAEQQLCQRLYRVVRRSLPAPDLIIYLTAPVEILVARHAARQRSVEVIGPADIPVLEQFVYDWVRRLNPRTVISVDGAADGPGFSTTIAELRAPVAELLGTSHDG